MFLQFCCICSYFFLIVTIVVNLFRPTYITVVFLFLLLLLLLVFYLKFLFLLLLWQTECRVLFIIFNILEHFMMQKWDQNSNILNIWTLTCMHCRLMFILVYELYNYNTVNQHTYGILSAHDTFLTWCSVYSTSDDLYKFYQDRL